MVDAIFHSLALTTWMSSNWALDGTLHILKTTQFYHSLPLPTRHLMVPAISSSKLSTQLSPMIPLNKWFSAACSCKLLLLSLSSQKRARLSLEAPNSPHLWDHTFKTLLSNTLEVTAFSMLCHNPLFQSLWITKLSKSQSMVLLVASLNSFTDSHLPQTSWKLLTTNAV